MLRLPGGAREVQLQIDNRTIDIDDEGYLVNPADWSEAVAEELARRENLRLEPLHWRVIGYMRKHLESRQVAADARLVVRHLAEDLGMGERARKLLFELFPYGYVRQACKIAGMRRPRAWSTG
jgi:TusE/DsrC/DsvC family sulfur relay protein